MPFYKIESVKWLKGKQVKILYDLVTVKTEQKSNKVTERFVWEDRICCQEVKVRKPASYNSTEEKSSDHE